MNARACRQLWQVEAARDGRLADKDLARARRHAETCTQCAAEARRLTELSAGIAKLPEKPLDPLSARRVRQGLLAAFNERVLEPAPARAFAHRAWLLAGGLVGALCVSYFWVGRTASPTPTQTRPSPVVEIQASAGARFSDRVEARLERVEFEDGSASLTVHPHPDRRVQVLLPDGEIADLGTIFHIYVEGGRTQRISVSDGRILVRLCDRQPFTLAAGESWQRETPLVAANAAAEPSTAPAPDDSARSRAAPRVHAPTARNNAAPVASARGESTTGDTTQAEDDAYLSIIESLRRGRADEARARAKSYLLHFPNGFRRVEVLNLATSTPHTGGE